MVSMCLSRLGLQETSTLSLKGKAVTYAISSHDKVSNQDLDLRERPGTLMENLGRLYDKFLFMSGRTRRSYIYIHFDMDCEILYLNPKYFNERYARALFYNPVKEDKYREWNKLFH